MRPALRLLAAIKPVQPRYLEPLIPTGLTGLLTNPNPRKSLLTLYVHTLDRLKAVPETSLYRQSVEAVTRQRLAIVEAAQPDGYAEWIARIREAEGTSAKPIGTSTSTSTDASARPFVIYPSEAGDAVEDAAQGDEDGSPDLAMLGLFDISPAFRAVLNKTPREVVRRVAVEVHKNGACDESKLSPEQLEFYKAFQEYQSQMYAHTGEEWQDEPVLTAAQIEELENKLGAGLIEEVIQVAEGELGLIDTMVKAKVWESLEEQPAEGQWKYFERKE